MNEPFITPETDEFITEAIARNIFFYQRRHGTRERLVYHNQRNPERSRDGSVPWSCTFSPADMEQDCGCDEIGGFTMHCKECGKKPCELEEYTDMVDDEDGFPGVHTPEDAVRQEEGTFNVETGLFYCTTCYIKIGMPLGTA